MNIEKIYLATNDTESTSLVNHALTEKAGQLVLNQGIPRLLELYAKYNILSTFYFTGEIVERYPEVVKRIIPFGHEVACHGYSHEVHEAFDVLTYNEQIENLRKTKDMLENISGQEVISFRAPALRVNSNTPRALAETGFKTDSSIASQRFDFFLSFGSIKKINRFFAPRVPYYTANDNLAKKGNGPILEIPISAMVFPYIGTTLRIFPRAISLFRYLLHFENSLNAKPINFLIHPNEFMDEERNSTKIKFRSKNIFTSFMADKVRYHLKLKNLGKDALPLYEREIRFFLERGYRFISVKNLWKEISHTHKKHQ